MILSPLCGMAASMGPIQPMASCSAWPYLPCTGPVCAHKPIFTSPPVMAVLTALTWGTGGGACSSCRTLVPARRCPVRGCWASPAQKELGKAMAGEGSALVRVGVCRLLAAPCFLHLPPYHVSISHLQQPHIKAAGWGGGWFSRGPRGPGKLWEPILSCCILPLSLPLEIQRCL